MFKNRLAKVQFNPNTTPTDNPYCRINDREYYNITSSSINRINNLINKGLLTQYSYNGHTGTQWLRYHSLAEKVYNYITQEDITNSYELNILISELEDHYIIIKKDNNANESMDLYKYYLLTSEYIYFIMYDEYEGELRVFYEDGIDNLNRYL